ncbi:cytospin-A-like isoform X2 [Hippocampus zosterae]|uniref:cytospin-A-like isoform X2 n=1 Tax=Hippocampus zosterae TaxID=109293 RepID=UPI00223CFB54|nr:cytospin-A-like isoform X2 [Hippocampus zosterae]
MGNMNYRSSAGSPLDFFPTPAMPSEADLMSMAMAISSTSSSQRTQTPSFQTATDNSLAVTDWSQEMSPPSEWAILSLDTVKSPNVSGQDEALEVSLRSLTSLHTSRAWPLEQSWQDGDSGLEPQASVERSGEELSRDLLGLMERHRNSLGLSLNTDATAEAVELVRQLITERDKLAEEVNCLRETLNNEKLEWQQFQLDLLATVSAADRMRTESEQALGDLEEDCKSLQEQLAQAHGRQLETQREMERLRSQHTDVCFRLSSLEKKKKQQQKMDGRFTEDKSNPAEGHEMKMHYFIEDVDMDSVEKQDEHEAYGEQDANRSASSQLTAKGIGKVYVDALEKKNGGGRDPRRIVMSSERSLSLSRIPLPIGSCHNNSLKTSSTLPQSKKEEPMRGRKMSHILKRQDSWSSCHTVIVETSGDSEPLSRTDVHSYASKLQMDAACTKPLLGKQHEDPPLDMIKPAGGSRAPLRGHGSARRKTLLSQCQSHTEGYRYIEITNFSTCWENGLAFCALYHKYLPTLIPYNSLNPAAKSVEEMLKEDGPDWHKVLCYVESIFHHFEMEVPTTQSIDYVTAT